MSDVIKFKGKKDILECDIDVTITAISMMLGADIDVIPVQIKNSSEIGYTAHFSPMNEGDKEIVDNTYNAWCMLFLGRTFKDEVSVLTTIMDLYNEQKEILNRDNNYVYYVVEEKTGYMAGPYNKDICNDSVEFWNKTRPNYKHVSMLLNGIDNPTDNNLPIVHMESKRALGNITGEIDVIKLSNVSAIIGMDIKDGLLEKLDVNPSHRENGESYFHDYDVTRIAELLIKNISGSMSSFVSHCCLEREKELNG